MYTQRMMIEPRPPFDFELTAKVFSDEVGLCMRDEQICKYSDGRYWRVFAVDNNQILVEVTCRGNVREPRLQVDMTSNVAIDQHDMDAVRNLVARVFDLNSDLVPFYQAVRNDRTISRIVARLYGLRVTKCPTVFEALAYVIMEQQISLRVAYNIERRFVKRFGDVVKVGDNEYYAFPTPERLSASEVDASRSCGLSRRKAEYIRDIARGLLAGKYDFERLREKGDDEILNELCSIRGIGPWTAQLVIIRGLGRMTVIPADDLGLRDHITEFYFPRRRERVSARAVRSIAKKWGKWQGLAGFYVVMAGRLGIDCESLRKKRRLD